MNWRQRLDEFCRQEGFYELEKEQFEIFIEDCLDAGDFDENN
ncbi:MAG: hypothetical protein AAB922_03245 [Patescibacteria group bacterium]